MSDAPDRAHMHHALTLARRGLGQVWPNPAVGCVIVKDGRILGRGWTQPGGRPHAETMALAQAGPEARGATAHVTLEPCAHHGKTPPCAEALIAAGIARVVTPLEDPDPRVAGKGLARLRAAGVRVDLDTSLVEEAVALNAGFLLHRTQNRPLLTLKLAMSLDGRIATATGESRWITGPEARRRVHLLRATHDAVLIGAGTARADDPMLDVRDLGLEARAPVRVIADGALSLPLTSRLAASARLQPLWLIHREPVDRTRRAAWRELGALPLPCATAQAGQLDPVALLARLAEQGLTRVLCEGGGQLAASLLRADLVDRLIVMQAGIALGSTGLPALSHLGIEHLADAPRFTLRDHQAIGGDTLTQWERTAF